MERRNKQVQTITISALIMAVYVVLTTYLPLQHEAIQFRIGEILVLFCFYNRKYCVAIIAACFLANLGSPFGPIDWVVGTAASALAVIPMSFIKNIWIAGMLPVITNAFLVGGMLTYFAGVDEFADFGLSPLFWFNVGTVAVGQFVVIMVVGVPLFKFVLEKNKAFMNIICAKDIKIQ